MKNPTLDRLVQRIQQANDAYHNTSTPIYTDAEYDALVEELESMDPSHAVLQHVGAPIEGAKRKLPIPMPSLQKMKTQEALARWSKKYPKNTSVIVSDKEDGVSILLYKKHNGKTLLTTRGNGLQGRDVSHLLEILPKDAVEVIPPNTMVRGEFVLPKTYNNARNLVAGAVNAKQPDANTVKNIVFLAYQLYPGDKSQVSPSDGFTRLAAYGFSIPPTSQHALHAMEESTLVSLYQSRVQTSVYDIDGLVLAADVPTGVPENESYPKDTVAFKTMQTHITKQTEVTEVRWNQSKDGILIPVVHFTPIVIDGATIRKVTGIHAAFVQKSGLGPGAHILVVRSGGVIPRLLETLVQAPEGAALPRDIPFVWDGPHIRATNTDALDPTQVLHFFRTLNPKGVSDKTFTKLIEAGYPTIQAILALTPAEITALDGFQRKSAEMIVQAIAEAVQRAKCEDWVIASNKLGRGIAYRKLQMILEHHPLFAMRTQLPSEADLIKIPGIQKATAAKFLEGIPQVLVFLQTHAAWCLEAPRPSSEAKEGVPPVSKTCENFYVVMTGARDKALQEAIVACGGTLQNAVSSKTTHVIAANPTENTSKLQKARERDIPILTPDAFRVLGKL